MAGLPALSAIGPARENPSRKGASRIRFPPPTSHGPGWPVRLVRWFQREARALPWRETRDPYRILVAEFLLQQTRVAQALPYYQRFLQRFPTLADLARAPESRVLKAWEGAGYYARARNLRALARQLVAERQGRFPRSACELAQLPGVGPYTSRALAALAFGERVVALDANGVRVLSRLEGKFKVPPPELADRAQLALGNLPPRPFNEALMELGQRYCLPRRPRCPECPLRGECLSARAPPDPAAFPPRRPAPIRCREQIVLGILVSPEGKVLVQQRPSHGLLGGLWELPGGRIENGEDPRRGVVRVWKNAPGIVTRVVAPAGRLELDYSHRRMVYQVFHLAPRRRLRELRATVRWVRPAELSRLALPRAVQRMRPWIEEAVRRSRSPKGDRERHRPSTGP